MTLSTSVAAVSSSSTSSSTVIQPKQTSVHPSPNAEKVGSSFFSILATPITAPYNYFFGSAKLEKAPEFVPGKIIEAVQASNMALFKDLKTLTANANLQLSQITEWVKSVTGLNKPQLTNADVSAFLKSATVFLTLLNSSAQATVKNEDFAKNIAELNGKMNAKFLIILTNAKVPAAEIHLFINQIEKALVGSQTKLSEVLSSYKSGTAVIEGELQSLEQAWINELAEIEQKAIEEAKITAEQPQSLLTKASLFFAPQDLKAASAAAASIALQPALITPPTRFEQFKSKLPSLHFVSTLPYKKLAIGLVPVVIAVASAIWYQQTHAKSNGSFLSFSNPFKKYF